MGNEGRNVLVVLGATASGKTRLGVELARRLGGDVVSADSRQVYRGLDIGSGKDLGEYYAQGVRVPYHLIDIVDLDHEFSVFEYQQGFYGVFDQLTARGVLPVLVGGTGLYIEAVLSEYRMVEVPEDPELRARLSGEPTDQLVRALLALKPDLHNRTDLADRERLVRAIEIAAWSAGHEPPPAPDIRPFVLGVRWDREERRRRIRERLEERLAAGLVEEVQGLLASGVPWEKLEFLGLEYRYVAAYLRGDIGGLDELTRKLSTAIARFAKRQDTWFRRMERHGTRINWVDRADAEVALAVVRGADWALGALARP